MQWMIIPAHFALEANSSLIEVKIDFASKADILTAEKWAVSDSAFS
jgi:hypothetical protein